MSLRARAALIGKADGLAVQIGARFVSGAPLRVAMYSPSGQAVSKAVCFLFREGDPDPRLVVKAMAEPRFDWRLRTESAVLESIRTRVAHAGDLGATLPPTPLLAAEAAGEFIVAESFDPLASATGACPRERAWDWLRAFQAASGSREQQWGDADERETLDAVRDAWQLAGSGTADAIAARVRTLLASIRGTVVPRCPVHGDFWRGNIAARDGSLRVYDWEWAALDGTPFVDLWTYELAELRLLARQGAALDAELAAALERVQNELRLRKLDERFALATLAPVLGALSFRIRTRLRMPDEMERHSMSVMTAAERLLAQS